MARASSSSPTRASRVRRHRHGRRRAPGLGRRRRRLRGGRAEPGRHHGRSAARRRCATSGWTARSSSRSAAVRRWTPRRPWTCSPPTRCRSGTSSTTATDLAPGCPLVAVPTTAGTGSEAHSLRRHHRRGGRAQGLHRPPEPAARRPRSSTRRLTVGLPPAVTAATGRRRDDPLARVAPVARTRTRSPRRSRSGSSGRSSAGCAARSPTARTSRRGRRCSWPRTWPASARRAARASASSTRSGTPSGRAGGSPTGRPSRRSCPRSSRSTWARATASWRWWASRSASARRPRPRPPPPARRSPPSTSSCATSASARPFGSLGLADDASIDRIVERRPGRRRDPQLAAAADAPREARAILESVAG